MMLALVLLRISMIAVLLKNCDPFLGRFLCVCKPYVIGFLQFDRSQAPHC